MFYPKDQIPAGITTDGAIWRIKVKNKPLDSSSLLMMGGGAIVGKVPEGLPTISIPADVKRAEVPIDPALAIMARFQELSE